MIIIIFLTSVEIPAFNYSFYSYEYEKNGTYAHIGISDYDLKAVTEKLMGYMNGTEDDLIIKATINGIYREFFNDLEKAHMEDVRQLFKIGHLLRDVSVLIFLITFLCAYLYNKRPALKEYAKSVICALSGFIIICIGFALIAISNFNKYFTIFHEIFFDNDMWILDPGKDLLINIVPLPFFIDIFIFAVITFFVFSFITILLCIMYLKYVNYGRYTDDNNFN